MIGMEGARPLDRKLGHYRILGPLGSGGMGDVFLAEDERLGRKVALKVIGAAQASNPIARKRLQREARAAAAIDHPGVCTIYDVSEAGGESFIAMQYVEGESLAARLRRSAMSREETHSRSVRRGCSRSEGIRVSTHCERTRDLTSVWSESASGIDDRPETIARCPDDSRAPDVRSDRKARGAGSGICDSSDRSPAG